MLDVADSAGNLIQILGDISVYDTFNLLDCVGCFLKLFVVLQQVY